MPVRKPVLRLGALFAIGTLMGAMCAVAVAGTLRAPVEGVRVSLLTNTNPSYIVATATTGENGIASLQLADTGGYTLAFESELPVGGSVLFTNGQYTLRLPVNTTSGEFQDQFILSFNARAGDIIMVRVEDRF